jgi:hypothetical protein
MDHRERWAKERTVPETLGHREHWATESTGPQGMIR